MDFCSANDSFVALILDESIHLDPQIAETLVRRELKNRKIKEWVNMYIDVFTAGGLCLLLARPNNITKISLAPYVIPWLMDYFTE